MLMVNGTFDINTAPAETKLAIMNGKITEVESKSAAAHENLKMLGRYARMLGTSILSHFRQIGWAAGLLGGISIMQGEMMVRRLAIETAEAYAMHQYWKAALLGSLTIDAQAGIIMGRIAQIQADRTNQYMQDINEMRDTYS